MKVFKLILILTFIASCNNPLSGNGSSVDSNHDAGGAGSGGSGSGSSVPSAPNSISLISPTSSPSTNQTPTVQIGGISNGDTVYLYSDACTTQIASGTSAGSSIVLTSSTLLEASYTLYARAQNSVGISACSTVTLNYNVDLTGPTVTVNQGGSQVDPAAALPLSFDIVFNEAINATSFTSADITNSGSASVTAWNIVNSGDNINFTLTATSISQTNGTVIPSIGVGLVNDLAGNSSSASTSSDNTVSFDTRTYGIFHSTRTVGSTNLNLAADSLVWGLSSSYSTNSFSINTAGNSEVITIQKAGDYFVSFNMPISTPAQSANIQARVGTQVKIRLNGSTIYDRASSNSFMRNPDSTGVDPYGYNTTNNFTTFLPGLSVGDTIELRVQSNTTQPETVNIAGRATLYLEEVATARTIYFAEATQTESGQNFNQVASRAQWTTVGVADTGFTLLSPEQLQLDAAGDYLVYVNLPLIANDSSERASVGVEVRSNGGRVPGGIANQGYMRNYLGTDNTNSSVHWVGLVSTLSANSVLDIRTFQDAVAGDIRIETGQKMTLFVERVDTSSNFFGANATALTSGSNWNTVSATPVNWTSSLFTPDSSYFSHSGSTVTIQADGDYLLLYNDSVNSPGLTRANLNIDVAVNSVNVTGASCASHYSRGAGGTPTHQSSSCKIVVPLEGLSNGDTIQIRATRSGNAGTINARENAFFMLKKQ